MAVAVNEVCTILYNHTSEKCLVLALGTSTVCKDKNIREVEYSRISFCYDKSYSMQMYQWYVDNRLVPTITSGKMDW